MPGFLALCLVASALHGAGPPFAGLAWLRELAGQCWRKVRRVSDRRAPGR